MLDMRFIRENVEAVKKGCIAKNVKSDIDSLLILDEERRKLLTTVEEKKHERNSASKDIGTLKRKGKDASAILDKMKVISDEIKRADDVIAEKEKSIKITENHLP